MIIQKECQIKIVPATIKYWKSKNYQCNISDIITVKTEDLPKNSSVIINCICDICNNKYRQRISRNTDVCGKCSMKMRLKGNKFGSKNIKYTIPSKEELINIIDSGAGKLEISKIYNVSIPVVNMWFDKHNIVVESYYGRKYFKSEIEEKQAINKIQLEYDNNFGISISEIARNTGIPRHIINKLRNDGKLNLKTKFDIWKEQYDNIEKHLDFYISENKTKDLKTISNEQNISIEHLKKAFREKNINVTLHSYNKSKGEIECREYIESAIGHCISKKINNKYEIDCFVPDKKFGVEYCGEYWHRYSPEKNNRYYHRDKTEYFRNMDINILTIFESEWREKNSIVKSMINSRLGLNKKIYARKCVIKPIIKNIADQFHNNNHLSGNANSSINLGLYYEDTLVCVLSIVKSRFDKKYEYEISRFSTLLNHNVIGGLGKLFSYFIKNYNPKSCMTYSDLRVGEGKSYELIGFKHVSKTPPNYFYYNKKTGEIESRMKYQKHKLKNMDNYSPNLTEYEIMHREGFYRIYDCGNNKYEWINNTKYL